MDNINGIINMSENNKVVVFDFAKNVVSYPISLINVSFQLDDAYDKDDQQSILKLLYNNNFIINSYPVVELLGDTYSITDNIIMEQREDLPAIITLSMESYNLENVNGFSSYISIEDKDNEITYNYKLYFQNEAINQYKTYDNVASTIAGNMESFMLLRTNPKLTGNIKLVASEDHLYLDTFKVSQTSILNDKKYRKKSISADGDYPYDVYKIFKDVPQGEMYSVYDDSYDPHKHYYNMDLQIENLYEYGAEYNTDHMYSENMKILAPLYIGKHLPTYFAIFKSDRLFTTDETVTNSDIFRSMIVESQCIKIYDLRQHSAIGKYLKGYHDMITKYFAGTCSLQFIEQEYDTSDENYRQGRNTWRGIAIDKGILTDKTETTYFGTQILNSSKKPQEDFNMFILNGYSRNMLLYPNILNLEFMFNDELADDMTLHNYFGLYLTENEFIHFNQVIKSKQKDGNYKMNYYDSDNQLININETPISVIDNSEYTDRIFFASTLNNATYLAVKDDLDLFIKNCVANKAYKNIVQIPGTKIKFDDSHKSFITLDFTKQIKYGEHFKFTAIDAQYKTDKYNVTIELIASNDIRLANTDHCVNPYVLTNNSERVLDDIQEDKNKLYRITFYTQDLYDNTKLASLEEQLERMRYAIQKVNSFLIVSHYDEETLGLISSQENVYFQHILADEVIEDTIEDPVRCFNYNNITYATLNEYIPDLYRLEDMPFANNGFELFGKRYSNITKFVKISKTSMVFYEVEQDLYDVLHNIKYPLIATIEGYQPMILFNVDNGELIFSENISGSKLSFEDITRACVTSPWNVKNCLVASPYEISSPNGYINISSPMPCSISLMGINNIKDIDMYVGVNEYIEHSTGISATFSAGEFVKTDNSDPRIRKYVPYTIVSGHIKGISTNSINTFIITDDSIFYSTRDSVIQNELIDQYIEFDTDTEIALADTNSIDLYDYKTYKPVLQENNYYINPTDTKNSNLEIPLVPLINCQWKSNGTYFDNNSLLDVYELFNHTTIGNFVQNIYTPAGLYNNQYIINSFKDYINYNGSIMTIQEFLLDSKYANAFKKFLTASFKVDTAIGYYNAYVQTLEFIYYGIKFTFKLSNAKYANEIKLNEYNNYEVYIINDYNSSDTNEIYISTIEEFILIINHIYKPGQLYSNNSIQTFSTLAISNAQYDWYSSPYNYLMQSSGVINDTLYLNKSEFYQLYDIDNISYIVEYDLPIYDSLECGFDETNIYSYFNASKYFDSFTKTDILYPYASYDSDHTMNLEYNFAFNNPNYKKIDYSNDAITNMINTYKSATQDYRKLNTYFVKNNDNIEILDTTYQDTLNEFIESFNANITLNIINNDNIKTIAINDSYKPLTLTISTPIRVKYNQGYFDPAFVDIFNFVINDEISDVINLDTLYANTQVSSIASIRNYYYNKVLDTNKDCTYNYFKEDQRSPFTTNWDNNLYRLYTDDTTYSTIPGYQLGIDDKMMFGSKVLAIHNDGIELKKWDYDYTNIQVSVVSSMHNVDSTTEEKLQIQLNLTKIFYNYILSLTNFVNNWANVEDLLNINVYINNYINNTLSKVYNFRNNFDVTLYELYSPELDDTIKSVNPSDRFITNMPNNFIDYEQTNNVETSFENVNNEIILTLTISNYNKYKYYPIVKINKI